MMSGVLQGLFGEAVEHVPASHQRLITQLAERGFHAAYRQWSLGDTVFVGYGEVARGGEGREIRGWERAAYLVPNEDGLWQVDIGISDDAPVPEEAAVERVTRLLRDEGEYEREFDRRRRWLEAALEVDGRSDPAEALYEKGLLLMQSEKNDLALFTLRGAIFHDPRHVKALCARGSILVKLKLFGSAEEEFRRALVVDAVSTVARVGLGQSLAAQGKQEEALREFEAVRAIDPSDFEALFGSAQSYAGLRKWDSALEAIELALEAQPGMPLVTALREQVLAAKS